MTIGFQIVHNTPFTEHCISSSALYAIMTPLYTVKHIVVIIFVSIIVTIHNERTVRLILCRSMRVFSQAECHSDGKDTCFCILHIFLDYIVPPTTTTTTTTTISTSTTTTTITTTTTTMKTREKGN